MRRRPPTLPPVLRRRRCPDIAIFWDPAGLAADGRAGLPSGPTPSEGDLGTLVNSTAVLRSEAVGRPVHVPVFKREPNGRLGCSVRGCHFPMGYMNGFADRVPETNHEQRCAKLTN